GINLTFADIRQHLPEDVTAIVSGGADGVDAVAGRFASALGIELEVILPDYAGSEVGRLAPLARNSEIIAEADYCLIYWDGFSRGTKDTIAKAVKAGKHGKVITIGSCVRNSIIRF